MWSHGATTKAILLRRNRATPFPQHVLLNLASRCFWELGHELDLTWCLEVGHGDLALVDNYTVMHGRRIFTGTRKVLVSLVSA